jgi:hypothetical protein
VTPAPKPKRRIPIPSVAIPASLWTQIITATLTGVLAYITYRTQVYAIDAANNAKIAAEGVRIEAEKATTADALRSKRLDYIAQVGDKTHSMVNSSMLKLLKRQAITARTLAETSPTNQRLKAEAEAAERDVKEHETAQAKDDARVKAEKEKGGE